LRSNSDSYIAHDKDWNRSRLGHVTILARFGKLSILEISMKTFIASVFALALLGTTAASAAITVAIGGGHGHHRHQVCSFHHHHRVCHWR
jgi:hypothetical protein